MVSNSGKPLPMLLSAVILLLIIELSISNIADVVNVANTWGLSLFLISASAFFITQYVAIREIGGITKNFRVNLFDTIVSVSQFVLVGVLAFNIFQIIIYSSYHTSTLFLSSSISWILAGISMCLLSLRFISWYRLSKSFIILSYAFAGITTCVSMFVSFAFYGTLILDMPSIRTLESEITFDTLDPGWETTLQQYYTVFNIIFFILLWISTALLLSQHSKRLGRTKYWIVISLPLASYLCIFLVVDRIIEASSPDLDIAYIVIVGYTLPNVISGILFGIPFWSVANSLRHGSDVRKYMIITGLGFVLFFVATTATVDHAPYPPLGLVSVSFIGFSSYLIFKGLYYSAVSVSEDSNLRQLIRKTIKKEVDLLGNIGRAQLQQQIEKKVSEVVQSQQENLIDTGVETSMDENEVKEYLREVIEELGKNR
jgi:hypothetical protein